MKEINPFIIEDFVSKVTAARKTNQKTVTLDIKEAQTLIDNLTLVLARAVGNLDKSQPTNNDNVISVSMDGGNF